MVQRCFVLSLFSFVILLQLSLSINIIYDETLWTKSSWDDWKIKTSINDFNPSDELVLEGFNDHLKSSMFNSIDGPLARRSNPTSLSKPSAGGEAEVLDDTGLLEPASQAAQCSVCHTLAGLSWAVLVGDIVSGRDVSSDRAKSVIWGMCQSEVVEALLSRYTLYKLESDGPSALVFFVIRERKSGTRPTLAERQAVRLSCQNLLRDSGDELLTVIMNQLFAFRLELPTAAPAIEETDSQEVEEPSVPSGSVRGYKLSLGDEDEEYMDALDSDDEEGEGSLQTINEAKRGSLAMGEIHGAVRASLPGESCLDLHPMCSKWARHGECEANPAYMLGTRSSMGNCRKSCNACSTRSAHLTLPPGVEELSAVALQAVRNLGCGASRACLTGVSGTAYSGQMVLTHRTAGGFVLGKPHHGQPTIIPVPNAPGVQGKLAGRKTGPGVRDGGNGADENNKEMERGEDGIRADDDDDDDSGQNLAKVVEKVLQPELAGVLLQIPAKFFVYEYLYRNHTRQFHEEADGKVTEDWLLGRFMRESVHVEDPSHGSSGSGVAVLEDLDLVPGMKDDMRSYEWPYLKQVYADGAPCVLAGGKKAIRRTQVRIACSPDGTLRMLVREPDFCQYIFVIYSPSLCSVPHYKPRQLADSHLYLPD